MGDKTAMAMLGGGQMGEAILSGLLSMKAFDARAITVSEPVQARREELAGRYGVRVTADNAEAVKGASLIVMAVKPQVVQAVLASVKGRIDPEAVIFSIVAGASIETLSEGAAHGIVVRAMPNTPAKIGKGVTAWKSSPAFPEARLPLVKTVLDAMGDEARLTDEGALDMVTALSGSGPAYVFLFMEALIDAGVGIGLPRDLAHKLVTRTFIGSSELLAASCEHPAVLRNQVTSPGGTTAAGLYCLEKGGLRAAAADAVKAAFERSRELGKGPVRK